MKTFTTLCALGALSLAAQPAAADSTIVRYQRHAAVYAADVDLAHEGDVRTLYERIAYAARAVCAPYDLPFAVLEKRDWRNCVRSAESVRL